MAALLILGGMLLIILGLLWLIVLAFGVSLLWGVGSLFPPILLLFIIRCWKVARKAVVFTALGFVPLIVGVTQLASIDAGRVEALLNLSWLHGSATTHNSTQIGLNGELYGQPFRPQYGELIDDVLLLREGKDFFARRELRIALPAGTVMSAEGLRLDVLPQDVGELPDIEIMWLLPEQTLPEARRISRGYTLHLDLQHQAPNLLTGNFHLVLPPQLKTSMSGEVQLLANRLHYLNGQVDRSYDDLSSLEYVVQDYLERRFNQDIIVQPFATPESFVPPLDMKVNAHVAGELRGVSLRLIKDSQSRWTVENDTYPARSAPKLPAELLEKVAEQIAQAPKTVRSVDRRSRFSLQRLLVNPAQYQYLQVHVETVQGNQVKGRFMGLDTQGALIISRELKAPGTVSFVFLPAEISQITLLEP
ncbi:MAG: MFS transporter [Pseudomonas sp.]|jgi:hypothetical protein|nr:MFS transporter [Pseudomonas sp.]